MIGEIVGNYRVLKKLGEGGMGTVYLARDLSLEREVALKIISPELARNPSLMARFRVEAIAQAKLNHSNITVIHSFDQQKDTYYIVMEYVDGKTLKKVIKEKGKIPLKQTAKIFSQILDGVAYAHYKGVVHRDIKPSNIFLTNDEIVKIGDFGIAKVEGIEGLTKMGSTLGSPLYCSPEQVMGKKTDARTDVYSLGMTLYEMLTGKLPFKHSEDSDYKIMKQVIEVTPQKPSEMDRTIPPAMDALVMKCLAKSAEERFQSVGELDQAFKKVMGLAAPVSPVPGIKDTPKPVGEIIKPPRKKIAGAAAGTDRKKILAVAVSLGIVLAFVVIYLVTSSNTEPLPQPTSNPASQVTQTDTSQHTTEIPRIMQPDSPKSSVTPGPVTRDPSSTVTTHTTPPLSVTGSDIPAQMDRLIRNNNYAGAVEIGEQAVTSGNSSAHIYQKLAQAYYFDGNKTKARKYYWKITELNDAFRFKVYYEYMKNRIIGGTLTVSGSTVSFQPSRGDLNSLRFSIPLSQIKRVNADYYSDLKGIFQKKKTRETPTLIIRAKGKQRYDIRVKRHDNTLRSFIKDIIDVLRD